MRSADTNRRIAQRARRDAEAELREPGREVVAELLSTGKHCRTYGVRISGEIVGTMGADPAWRAVSKRVPRMMSLRRCF
jgi:hypothetical protein